MEKYFQKELETMPREELKKLQSEKLVRQVRHAWDNCPDYRKKMEEAGVTPDDIKGIEDLHKLPFTSKDDLRDNYPFAMLAKPLADCVRIHSTSGTTGKRVIAYYTADDIHMWDECCARALAAAGTTREDMVQVSYGYGLFTGGAGFHGGSHLLGSTTIPMSSGNTDRQLQFMADLGTTVLCCTPSYAAYLGETIKERGIGNDIKLKAGIFGAEAWSEEMRRDIQEALGIKAYDIYGLTELSGPGVAYECSAQSGMHVNEDHFIAEIVDPETFEPLPAGSKGELVFTSLDKEAMPIIRYRTKDICVLSDEECSCGRTFIKMAKPMGRSDDMLIIKGVNVFPSQIETVLLNNGYQANYQIIVDRVKNTDTFDINVELTPDKFTGNLGDISKKEKALVLALKSMLGIMANVHLVPPKSIARSEGKAVRIIDNRKI